MEIGGIIALCTVLPLLIGIPIVYFTVLYFKYRGDLVVSGMKFDFDPENMVKKLPVKEIEAVLKKYSEGMAAVFGISVSDLENHFAEMRCRMNKGFLSNEKRENAGLSDSDDNGSKDRIVGLTHGSKSIEVAILFSDDVVGLSKSPMIDKKGNIILSTTAFVYEMHNAMIWKFAGYDVVMAEAFISPDNASIQKLLGVSRTGLKKLLAKRAVYDAALKTLNL